MNGVVKEIDSIMRLAAVIPVVVSDEIRGARAVAEVLVECGLVAIEVALRTPNSLAIIREMATVEGAVLGAGTVLNEQSLDAALQAGARFIVSPGLTKALSNAAQDRKIPFLPGVATASDIMRGLDLGLNRFKFFPAEASGGINALTALSAPFTDVRFCPTGGVTLSNAANWLALKSVLCVGGTWIVPPGAFDPLRIKKAASEAAGKLQAT